MSLTAEPLGSFLEPEFSPDVEIGDTLSARFLALSSLLNAAIRAAGEGVDRPCKLCWEVEELLTAYRDALNFAIDAADAELLARRKGGAIA